MISLRYFPNFRIQFMVIIFRFSPAATCNIGEQPFMNPATTYCVPSMRRDEPRRRDNFENSAAAGSKASVEGFFTGLLAQLNLRVASRRERFVGGMRASFDRGDDAISIDDNACKQPLLLKACEMEKRYVPAANHQSDATIPLLPGRRDNSGEPVCSSSRIRGRYDKHKSRAEREADEARGQGTYLLHAVLGQGSFGRIHLASWREDDGGSRHSGETRRRRRNGEAVPRRSNVSNDRGDLNSGWGTRTTNSRFRHDDAGAVSLAISDRKFHDDSFSMTGFGASVAEFGQTVRHWARSYVHPRPLPSQSAKSTCVEQHSGAERPHASFHPAWHFADKLGPGDEAAGSSGSWRVAGGKPRVNGDEGNDDWSDGDEEEDSGSLWLRVLKSVCKRKVTEKGLTRHMETELEVLKQCSHPYIVSLLPGGHFQTSGHVHLVLDYCPGGDLFSLLEREGRLAEPQARVCAAQLALALRHLHNRHIVYRDLKPENVCLDFRGHAVLVDFSLAKTGLDRTPDGKTFTFCGSAAYVAPEMLAKSGHDTRVDLWSLGCVMFEGLAGTHPFRRQRAERTDRQAMFERIRLGQPEYPRFLTSSALSLLQGLLTVNPDQRLGFPAVMSRPPRTAPERPKHLMENPERRSNSTQIEAGTPKNGAPYPPAKSEEVHVATAAPSAGPTSSLPSLVANTQTAAASSKTNLPDVGKELTKKRVVGQDRASVGIRGPGNRYFPANTSTQRSGNDRCNGADNTRSDCLEVRRVDTKQHPAGSSILEGHTADGMRCTNKGAREGRAEDSGEAEGEHAETYGMGCCNMENTGRTRGEVTGVSVQPLLLEHRFFCGLPGWGGQESGGAWDESKLMVCAVMSPDLRDELDVRYFDPKFTSQTVELILQGHPHKGGPTPSFDSFDWRPDECIERAQIEERRRAPGFLGSMASALWC